MVIFKMAAEIGALAVSHLEEISNDGIAALARSGTVGVLLPTTAFALHLKPPPARAMIQSGMCIALGSDFNPNVHCLAMVCVFVFIIVMTVLLIFTYHATCFLTEFMYFIYIYIIIYIYYIIIYKIYIICICVCAYICVYCN